MVDDIDYRPLGKKFLHGCKVLAGRDGGMTVLHAGKHTVSLAQGMKTLPPKYVMHSEIFAGAANSFYVFHNFTSISLINCIA